ncbi:MAG: DUF4149 domain-containing protein [Alphaproteobacteria bacterium]
MQPIKSILSSWFWVWFGIIIGLSFMATPIKFHATQLELPVALEVGKVTFQLLAKAEWFLAIALVVALVAKPNKITLILIAAMVIILVLQQLWLMPALYGRADAVIAGGTSSSSVIHLFYIIAEVAKLVALAGLGFFVRR